jgi:hypothetical protein
LRALQHKQIVPHRNELIEIKAVSLIRLMNKAGIV